MGVSSTKVVAKLVCKLYKEEKVEKVPVSTYHNRGVKKTATPKIKEITVDLPPSYPKLPHFPYCGIHHSCYHSHQIRSQAYKGLKSVKLEREGRCIWLVKTE